MAQLAKNGNCSLQSKLGVLVFDEMKIKEGLVWSAETNELLGFTDINSSKDGKEENIASNILQFFFKSLFSNFNYPCAYIAVRNITSFQISSAFWEGVSLLHTFGFNIILSICDGASENRKFITTNAATLPGNPKEKHYCINPYTNGPLYFISDPPHLIKK
ncbi:unnamed protein product [Mytilus coruscus]|uniref:Transposable element P transposase-like RNase H domain-containing protein n=1 Tax=Mytilus coruscus TaxID=42192 RepID=A0A6J8C349_MYTCO|nr:unnamed protein product [Mytilus coruscus]